jgi:hypothetical protein
MLAADYRPGLRRDPEGAVKGPDTDHWNLTEDRWI